MSVTSLERPRPALRVLLPALALGATLAAFALLASIADSEARRAPATCLAAGCYCEAVAVTGVRQAVDAWSSLAPAVAGALVLALAFGPRPALGIPLAQSRVPHVMIALAACSIAIFSFHYHATLTWLGEWLDGVSLFLLAGFGLAWAIVRSTRRGMFAFAAVYLGVAALPAILSWFLPETRKASFVVLALAAIAVEWRWRRRALTQARTRWLTVAIGSFLVAGVAWVLDWTRVVCDPRSPLQLHALWHLLSLPTVVALDRYFASEAYRPSAP